MNDYNFGLNLVTLLNSLAILDDHEIDSNQVEVEVVEENGQEGFATVEIQSLAKDAADTITALQQKLDAMAADIALNGWVACSPEWIDKNGPCSCEAAPRIAFGNIGPHYHPQSFTPTTDAFLNSVRAEGAMAARNHIRKGLTAFHYEYHGVVAECADMAEMVAQRLRSGTHDTADKAG